MKRKTEKAIVLTATGTPAQDRLVGRAEAARIIGMSESSLRRRERTDLPPVIDNGVHRHRVETLLKYKVEHLSVQQPEQGFDGPIAAAAFELFDEGLGPADVVRSLRIDPRLARDLHGEWADLRGTIVIGGKSMAELLQIWWLNDEDGEGELRTGEDLVRELQKHETRACIGCKGRPSRLCPWCFLHRAPRAVEAAKEVIRAAQTAARAARQRRIERRAIERAEASRDEPAPVDAQEETDS